ncbi:MAG: ParB N-terminal domain-containing protein [Bryobacterales bacterium]|nr:ParB N-terminal domain-containing protein [Bryobacterales bacterium]
MNGHAMSIADVPCDAVRIGERHRRDMGDLEILAVSIATEGLLQPIGITEDSTLVFGERRLLAVRDVLKQPTIAARIVRVSSILAGEFAENDVRKDFTPSERAAIGKAIEAGIGNRQGRRTDMELPGNFPEVEPGAETREIAARKAGFGNAKTYEQAKRVVEKGTPELVAAMDSGEVSISAAAVIATEPAARQAEILKQPGEIRREITRALRKAIGLPTTGEARRLARETGTLVADNTGRYRSGAPAEERAATKADLDAIWNVTRAVLALADTRLDPLELSARLEYWHCPGVRAKTPAALQWLTEFQTGVERNEEIS